MSMPEKLKKNKESRKHLYATQDHDVNTGAHDSYDGERCEHGKLEGDCPDCNEMSEASDQGD